MNRKKYMGDAAARDFLKKHPEFDNEFLEQREATFFNYKGSFSLKEIDPNSPKFKMVETLKAALLYYPNETPVKKVMEMYFAGNSISEIQRAMGFKRRAYVFEFISNAKKKLLKNYSEKLKEQTPLTTVIKIAEKTIVYGKRKTSVILAYDADSDDYVWLDSNGFLLDEEIQKILDEDPEYSGWDDIFILKE